MLRTPLRVGSVFVLFGLSLACGGKSASREGDQNQGGEDSGVGGSAGTPQGGRGGSAGSDRPIAGSGGSGGRLPAVHCAAPSVEPGCALLSFYAYLPASGECEEVATSGCPNPFENAFLTLEECLAACPGALPDPKLCETSSDCVLALPGCCAPCEPIARDGYVALRRDRADLFTSECGGVACGACNEAAEAERTGQYWIATCTGGMCQVTDIRTTDSTRCSADSDCHLRDGADCCEGCDGSGLIAVSNDDWIAEGCRQQNGCDACVPNISGSFAPACGEDGRCFVRTIPF